MISQEAVFDNTSSDLSSLDSYELEFKDVDSLFIQFDEENSIIDNDLKEFKFEDIVSKMKNMKKLIRCKTYMPFLVNYNAIINVFKLLIFRNFINRKLGI